MLHFYGVNEGALVPWMYAGFTQAVNGITAQNFV